MSAPGVVDVVASIDYVNGASVFIVSWAEPSTMGRNLVVHDPADPRVMIGYDGSLPAAAAIEVAARLLPHAHAHVAVVWTPPFASEPLRRRLWHATDGVNEFVAAVEREGAAEASRLAAMGVVLAGACGWNPEPVVRRTYGGEGFQLEEIAEDLGVDLIVVGSRGLGGTRAILGSISDVVVHYAQRPVLVVPQPLLQSERAVLDFGPVIVGWDGSAAAEAARDAVAHLFPGRAVIPVAVTDGDPGTQRAVTDLVTIRRVDGHLERGRSIAAALTAQARTQQAAMIAVGSRGRSVMHEILLGSVAMATLHHAYRPVLVVPQRALGPTPAQPS